MPLPAVSTLKGGVAEGAGSVDYTPPMAKHLQLLRLHAERGSSGRGSWHESFSLVFWVSQRIENKCRKKEKDRERGRWRERQETRQQNKTTKDSTAQVSMLSCDAAAAISLEQTNEQRGVCATLRLGPQTEAAKMRAMQKL